MPHLTLSPFRPSAIQFVRLAITVLLPQLTTTLHAATCVNPPADMVAWWRADNSSLDQLGSAHLTRGSSVGYTNGVSGSAFSFRDNVNSVVVLPQRAAWMPPGNQLTIECWIKPDFTVSGDKLDTILSKRDGCGTTSFQFGVYKGHQSKKGPLYFGSSNFGGDSTSSIPNDGQFHHVAVTFDGSQPNSNTRFYIDGVPAGVINGSGVFPVTSSAPVIGAHGGCPYYSQMALDELSFYHRALSASEIQAIHAAGSAGKCASPISGVPLPLVTDFENGTGPGWTGRTTLSTTEPQRFTKFLGRIPSGEDATLTLTGLTPGVSYTASFDFYAIDSWDGGSVASGDAFIVATESGNLFRDTFSNFGAQSYPGAPDEGRAQFGFHASHPDSIYHSLQVVFAPSNSTTFLRFQGANLQDVGDESWGIDNLRIQTTDSLPAARIHSSTLPTHASTNSIAIDFFTVSASLPLSPITATNAANWSLKEAGANGQLGDGDDVSVGIVVSPTALGGGGRSVAISPTLAPLGPGRYRFSSGPGLLATNNVAIALHTQDFSIVNPIRGRIEGQDNGTLGNASDLALSESPGGGGFLTSFGVGSFSAPGDVDFWRIDAEAGDVLTVEIQAEGENTYPQLQVWNLAGSNLRSTSGDYNGRLRMEALVFAAPGTYYLRVTTDNRAVPYQIRADLGRTAQLEDEPNDSALQPTQSRMAYSGGVARIRAQGVLRDTPDWFNLQTLNPGNSINITLRFPDGSTLPQRNWSMVLYADSTAIATNSGTILNHAVTTTASFKIQLVSSGSGIRDQYLLDMAVNDSAPPSIVSTTLPANGTSTGSVLDGFTLQFSQELDPSTVQSAANYDLRSAGSDGLFGTKDDIVYPLVPAAYSFALSESYFIQNGPIQPGPARFTVSTELKDLAANRLSAPYVLNFSVTNTPNYTLEAAGPAVFGFAPPVGGILSTGSPSGFFGYASDIVGGRTRPEYIKALDINGDGWVDLAAPHQEDGGTLTLYTNDQTGRLFVLTNIPARNSISVEAGRFNNDEIIDFAVTRSSPDSTTIVLGAPDGVWIVGTNITSTANAYQHAVADFNGDGFSDLAVPNSSSGTIYVLRCNGNGGFLAPVTYSVSGAVNQVVAGLLNNDAHVDLVAAGTSASGRIAILLNNGDGTFQAPVLYNSGPTVRSVAIADMNGDGIQDVVASSAGDYTVNVFRGNGDGTFAARKDYRAAASDVYRITVGDLDGDNRPDVIVPGYGSDNWIVLMNRGDGELLEPIQYSLGNSPIGASIADFNRDGRADIAMSRYNGGPIALYLGMQRVVLAQEPGASEIRSAFARGTISGPSDIDYFQFHGTAGDSALLAMEAPGNPGSSGLQLNLLRADGGALTSVSLGSSGGGQTPPVVLPYTGIYWFSVSQYYEYRGEYHVRVSMVSPPATFETEGNGSVSTASLPAYRLTNGVLRASSAGYVGQGDPAGDFYSLGWLKPGTTATLELAQSSFSGSRYVLSVVNSKEQLVLAGGSGTSTLTFPTPGTGDNYYARVQLDPTPPAVVLSGQPGSALLFNGANQYLRVEDHQTLRPINVTLEAWVSFASTDGVQAVIAKGYGAGDDNSYALYFNSGSLRTYGAGVGEISFPWQPKLGQWYHVAYTFDDAANLQTLYIDGQTVAVRQSGGSHVYDTSPLVLGGDWTFNGPGYFFNGKIDDIRIWNTARASNEIAAVRSERLTGNEPGLAGYWRLDEGSGFTADDSSPNNNVATAFNQPAWSSSAARPGSTSPLVAQYLLRTAIQDASPLEILSLTLPTEGASVSNLWQAFTVQFDEELDPQLQRINRPVLRRGNMRYLPTDLSTTWEGAQTTAAGFGGNLVTISNAELHRALVEAFPGLGDFWIGLNDRASEGAFVWASGSAVDYLNWQSNEPDNDGASWREGNADGAVLPADGSGWYDDLAIKLRRGLIEVPATPDSDGDGLPNGIDPYANDRLNGLDLRSPGQDGNYDTPDDLVYRLDVGQYTGGTRLSVAIVDGPLQAGPVRFTATTSLRDRNGNPLASALVRNFVVRNVPNYLTESTSNNIPRLAIPLNGGVVGGFEGAFTPGDTLSTGANPYNVVTADLNSDGRKDLVVANYTSDTVSVLLAKPGGGFVLHTNLTGINGAIGLSIGDFNKDTKPDLAAAAHDQHRLHIFLGDGSGSFTQRTNYPTGSNPQFTDTADLDQDGNLDIITANRSSANLSVFLGNGDGTFATRTDIPAQGGSFRVAACDLDGIGGTNDLVVLNRNVSSVTVLLGNGSGGFGPPNHLSTTTTPGGLVVADFDGDGQPDIAALCHDTMNFFPGVGDGTLKPRITSPSLRSSDVYGMEAVDLDGDGDLDLVVPSYGNSELVTILNLGEGRFGGAMDYPAIGNPIMAALGDFNLDGRLDVVTANYGGGNIRFWYGLTSQPIPVDVTTGIRTLAGRGSIYEGSDLDHWTFSAQSQDRLVIATESHGLPVNSQLFWRLYGPNGVEFDSFRSDNFGRFDYTTLLGAPGIYTLRVERSDAFAGEYRFRVSLLRSPTTVESESNDNPATADPLSFKLVGNEQQAEVHGYSAAVDEADYYLLGNLSGGTEIKLTRSSPSSAGVTPVLSIHDASGVRLDQSTGDAPSLTYITSPGASGAYYARVTPSLPTLPFVQTNVLRFDGSDSRVTLGSWTPGKRYSLQAWVFLTHWQTGRRGVLNSAGACQDWGIVVQDGRLGAIYRPANGSCGATLAMSTQAELGRWHHVVASSDGTNLTLHVNGAMISSAALASDYNPYGGGVWIGGEVCCGNNYFHGAVAQAAIWNRPLAGPEVASLAGGSVLIGNETGLVGLWRLNDGSGLVAADASSQGRNGTLAGDPLWASTSSTTRTSPDVNAQYKLNVALKDGSPPFVTASSLPAEGSNTTDLVDRFTLTFSEDMAPATVRTNTSYQLRNAGANRLFDGDDQFCTVLNTPLYSSGLTASYVLPEGPLTPGLYQFTALTTLTDPSGGTLASNFVRRFEITQAGLFVTEARNNDSLAGAQLIGTIQPGSLGAFRLGTTVPVGANPEYTALVSIGPDVNLDLLTVNYGANNLMTHLGNGSGGFTLQSTLPSPTSGNALKPLLGNFNGDASIDLAVTCYDPGSVAIFRGNAGSQFTFLTNYPTGRQTVGITSGDFNGDGHLDLATAAYQASSVTVLLGNGNGTFQTQPAVTGISGAYHIHSADFNKDGKLDLAVSAYGVGAVAVLLGNGNGTFTSPQFLFGPTTPTGLAVADFNQDGNVDIATGSSEAAVFLFPGQGTGAFNSPLILALGASTPVYDLAATDLNGDGMVDLVASLFDHGRIAVLLQTQPLAFSPATFYPTGSQPIGIAVGDLNADGIKDLVVANYGANSLTVLMGLNGSQLPAEGAGRTTGAVRGNITTNNDTDWFAFDAQEGDTLEVAIENLGDPAASGRCVDLLGATGETIDQVCGDYYGRNTGVRKLTAAGRYHLRVRYSYESIAEYRLRFSLVRPPTQVDVENNDAVSSAQRLTWTSTPGALSAQVAGTIHRNDPNGDYFHLGNLSGGSAIAISQSPPPGSTLSAAWTLWKNSTSVATFSSSDFPFSFQVPEDGQGAYYLSVRAIDSSAGIYATYRVSVQLSDVAAPQLVATSLPNTGGSTTELVNRFTLTFDEDLAASTGLAARRPRLFGGNAYLFTTDSLTWPAAQLQAQSLGGNLVSINSAAENDWLALNFGANRWIGLTDRNSESSFAWVDGSPLTYQNWNSGEPNNAGDEDFASLLAGGKWNDVGIGASQFGIIEFSGPDADGDGLPDAADPYPTDPINLFDLRASGPDGLFDTSDDQRYQLQAPAYTTGVTLSFALGDGPLQPGNYRLRISTSLADRFGNPAIVPTDHLFSVAALPPYTAENRSNNTAELATTLAFVEGPGLFRNALARGSLFDSADVDQWSFQAEAGDQVMLAAEMVGAPGGTGLRYRIISATGVVLREDVADYYGYLAFNPVTIPESGICRITVSVYWDPTVEYRFRVALVKPPQAAEQEPNQTIPTAVPITLAQDGSARFGSAAGWQQNAGDIDYYSLDSIAAGQTVFLNARAPLGSTGVPAVALYNAAGQFQDEVQGGRNGDNVAEVRILTAGTYYALVRGGGGSQAGIRAQYILNVQSVPTGAVSFPNLQVSTVNLPQGSPLSGQTVQFSFAVVNAGALQASAASWVDRAVLSLNPELGDADDIPLGFFDRFGALNPGGGYVVNGSIRLPDGISGAYYLIAQTDVGNAVNEFIFESDNITVSDQTVEIQRAPYPDLRIEDLQVSAPSAAGSYTITWNTANRGTAVTPIATRDRLIVRNLTSGQVISSSDVPLAAGLGINGLVGRQTSITTTNPGTYQVQVSADALDQVYEFADGGHEPAEVNTASAQFIIAQFFTIALDSAPVGGGTVAGGGSIASGSTATVRARANTNTLPYFFVNWSENGVFQSTLPDYSFVVTRARSLVANFSLPTYSVLASAVPSQGGSISGQGTHFHGSTSVLAAVPAPGYNFVDWRENGVARGSTLRITNVITANRVFVANFAEANPTHTVSVSTSPSGLVALPGAGTYTNGQTLSITAPAKITNSPTLYVFKEFRLNNSPAGANPTLNKTFSTLDPATIEVVAVYDSSSLLPVVVSASGGFTNTAVGGFTVVTNPIPASTQYRLTLQFDRSMNPAAPIQIQIPNTGGGQSPTIQSAGSWFATAVSNDTYRTGFIPITQGMDGPALVRVSLARDANGLAMAQADVLALRIDATPPTAPVIAITSSNSTSITVGWASYNAPADLGGFRVYRSATTFSALTGLIPLTTLPDAARSYTFQNLALDTPYFLAVGAIDIAGNAPATLTPLAASLPRSVPPQVALDVAAPDSSTADLSWNSYNATGLLGFGGFWIYYETNAFTSVAGLTPRQTLAVGSRAARITGLDRRFTYHFAVVGFNTANGHNVNVVTKPWNDPVSGRITSSLTLGGSGAPIVEIFRSITIANNATLTIRPGTTVRFASGASLTVEQGRLIANGSALEPILFTSMNDAAGQSPAPGDWDGLLIGAGAGASSLKHVFVHYGRGLTLSNSSPTLEALTLQHNASAGLRLLGSAGFNGSEALIAFNQTGIEHRSTTPAVVRASVIKNNTTNALAGAGSSIIATQVWWGVASAPLIDAALSGSVNRSAFLSGEPLLTPATGLPNAATQTGSRDIQLLLACRTADAMRVSENSSFAGVFYRSFAPTLPFQLSAGGGLKTVYAQFRSVTGETSAPIALTLNFITDGPAITATSLSEGQILTRPLRVTASATAPLGMAHISLHIDDGTSITNSGGAFSHWLDIRASTNGVRRVRFSAYDNSGNLATREFNVTYDISPPSPPVIVSPATDISGSATAITLSGTAEPFIGVRLAQNNSAAASVMADALGTWTFENILLTEGNNAFVATAFDNIGGASSPARNVVRDTGPPSAPILDGVNYNIYEGLSLSWAFATSGERPVLFRVLWHTNVFSTIAQASRQSPILTTMSYRPPSLVPGRYHFAVVGYDAAGNASPLSNLIPFTYDPTPPSFAISFAKTAPVGVGLLRIQLVASEPLIDPPSLTLLPARSQPLSLILSNAALNTYEALLNVTPTFPSGTLGFIVSGRDLSGNTFNGPPSGEPMVIDVEPPSGVLAVAPAAPIQATNPTPVTVNLRLSEPAKGGTTPELAFAPPSGALVIIPLTGNGSNWVGTLTALPSMGSGSGTFTLTASDALDNIGRVITSGRTLELYNTPLPRPPGQPVQFQADALKGGAIRLVWGPVSNAEIYRVYSQSGTNQLVTPTVLIADNISTNTYIDVPAADGSYMYAVTALRRGAEGTNSITRVEISDRTPPSAPINPQVRLLASGVQVTWAPGAGPAPAAYKVYRNGQDIRTVSSGTTAVIDGPPRGIMNYSVGALDSLGNEARSGAVAIELLVGAVNSLTALVKAGEAPTLSWTSSDNTAVGFNIYRNGVKQNPLPVPGNQFTDTLGIPLGSVVGYTVRAVNSTNAESAPRSVSVNDVSLDFFANLVGGSEQPLVNHYFDNLLVILTNRANAGLPLDFVQVRRTIPGQPSVTRTNEINATVGASTHIETNVVIAASSVLDPQSFLVRAYQEADEGGSRAIYEASFAGGDVVRPVNMISVTANQQPLAGGLSTISLLVYNHGFSDLDLLVARNNGDEPGDLSISVRNSLGLEVSRTDYKGVPPGTSFLPDGRAFIRIPPAGSRSLQVPGVLVPESLGTNTATFFASFASAYYRLGRPEQTVSGPINGSMSSSLAVTPYYGVARTDRPLYSDDLPILISGEAIDRSTGLPKANAPLRLGFAISGAKFYHSVTSDASGRYVYNYAPPQGMSGTLKLWAAHPDVVDTLNQAEVKLYRCYLSPANVDIRMSKNGTQKFFLTLINTGDETLTGFTLQSQAFVFEGATRKPTTAVRAKALMDPDFVLGPRSTEKINFELEADLDAPDNVVIEFSFRSTEGATAKFQANLTLLQANPLLVVIDPSVGYVEASVNRGEIRSRSVTVINRGLRPLEGVTMRLPTNVNWMTVNLPADSNRLIHLPDMPIGSSNTFTVVFAPPDGTALDNFADSLQIRGTNSPAAFNVGLFALVTSSAKGHARFYVDNILVEPVPNASVRIRNTLIGQDYTVKTDANGYADVKNLQEGPWAWQVNAPGHSAEVGVIEIVPDQTILVEPRLSRALVTVNFSVVPVPYTDRYEIIIEQTFETHVPAPVLVLTPPHMDFKNVGYGYEATYIVKAKNHGLIQMTDVTIKGMNDGKGGTLSPLISYIPVLRAQESVEIPMRFTYATADQFASPGSGRAARTYNDRRKSLIRDIDENGNITGGVQFPPSFGDNASPAASFADCATGGLGGLADFVGGLMAIANACAQCADLRTAMAIAASAAVTYSLLCSPNFSPLPVSPLPCPSGNWVVSFFINLASCACQALGCFGTGGGGTGPGGGGNNPGPSGFSQFSPSGPACFTAETRVMLSDGSLKRIADIKPGDLVRTGSGSHEFAPVRETQTREINGLIGIRAGSDLLESSPDHLIWLDGKGWTLAALIRQGDWLHTHDGRRVEVNEVLQMPGAKSVYTFINSGDHAFYANGFLVHDGCGRNPQQLSPASLHSPPLPPPITTPVPLHTETREGSR